MTAAGRLPFVGVMLDFGISEAAPWAEGSTGCDRVHRRRASMLPLPLGIYLHLGQSRRHFPLSGPAVILHNGLSAISGHLLVDKE